jgi:hypothetical protein
LLYLKLIIVHTWLIDKRLSLCTVPLNETIIICFLRTINASSNITPIRKSFPHNKLFTYISHGVLSILDIRSTPKNNRLDGFVGLLCLMPLSTIFRLYPGIVEVSFIGGGNRSTLRKPPTCCKSPRYIVKEQNTKNIQY